jgi:hypothetical protein
MSTEIYSNIFFIFIFNIVHVPFSKAGKNIYSNNFVIMKRQ